MATYLSLSRAGLTFDYLHTNSTTHEFLFGALAELLDNARDASASRMDVYTEFDGSLRGGYMLCFLDDGTGMDPAETASIIQFGKSSKRLPDGNLIGQYGNGLKSGTMRIGRDFMLFTKQGTTMSCLFLSRTFHEQEKIEEVIVPLPSFDSTTGKPLIRNTHADQERHRVEMELILKYSPFHTEEEFFRQFKRIKTSGTLVIVYHMKLLDNGEPELDVFSDDTDILMGGLALQETTYENGMVPERRSFRGYASILYAEPKMKIYIQGLKVRTKKLTYMMYKPRLYKYTSNRFKRRSENDAARALEAAKLANELAREATSKAKDLEIKYKNTNTKDSRAKVRQAQAHAQDLKEEAAIKQRVAESKQKAMKEPKTLDFIFGMNIENRRQQGMFIYNCKRLVKMYEKVGPQQDGGVMCSGVLGFVNIPYIVLEPTHNKQDFADYKEYRLLLKSLGEHMVQYWKDISIANQGVTKYWETYGYISFNWKDPPSHDHKYIRKRAMQLPTMIQCDVCLKWRQLPFSTTTIGKEYPEDWECVMSKDLTLNRCSYPEKKLAIPTGTLKKDVKTADEKQKDLEDEIRRKQEKLEQIEKTKRMLSKQRSRSPSPPPPPRSRATPKQTYKSIRSTPKSAPKPAVKPKQVVMPKRQFATKPKPVGKASPVVQQPPASPKAPQRYVSATPTKRPSQTTTAAKGVAPRRSSSKSDNLEFFSDGGDTDGGTYPGPTKKRRTSLSSQGSQQSEEMTDKDTSFQISDRQSLSSETDTELEGVGVKVETLIKGQWHRGHVVKVSRKTDGSDKWKVKFDDHPKDKFDKWYDKDSSDLRLQIGDDTLSSQEESALEDKSRKEENEEKKQRKMEEDAQKKEVNEVKEKEEEERERRVKQDKSKECSELDKGRTANKESENLNEDDDVCNKESKEVESDAVAKTTTLGGSGSKNSDVEMVTPLTDSLAEGFRTCLRYFLPPNWTMTKEDINSMDAKKLTEFPLDNFFDHYEKGLRDLVGRYQMNAEEKETEASVAQNKLSNLRKMVAQLLSTLHDTQEEISIESMKGDDIDNLLAVCLKDQDSQE